MHGFGAESFMLPEEMAAALEWWQSLRHFSEYIENIKGNEFAGNGKGMVISMQNPYMEDFAYANLCLRPKVCR